MNILQVNKCHHQQGGANRYYFELSRILQEMGNTVVPFSMKDPLNEPTPHANEFVENIDFTNTGGLLYRTRCFFRVIYSFEARKKIRSVVDRYHPDIAHLHNIYHQLSPSILSELKKSGIPVVMTAHDLKLICPNYTSFDGQQVCEKCWGGKTYQVLTNRCQGQGVSKRLTLALEAYLHRFLGSYMKHLDVIIAPSRFLQEAYSTNQVSAAKIVLVPNFVDPIPDKPEESEGNYLLYFGRLSEEKGVVTLIQAMRRFPENRLVIAGDGPQSNQLERLLDDQGMSNVDFVGWKSADEISELIRGSMFTIIPSIWYENCPLSVLESMALGRPVIGSRIGGIPDLIDDGKDGLLFFPGDENDLADKIEIMLKDRESLLEMGRNAHRKVQEVYNKDNHIKKITSIYNDLLERGSVTP